ncbi:MAG: hypothetical protein EB156_05840 [Euryarchaeota archaeon]|nr:hypothetical protein [Euryarchaeota archaeon]NDG22154.1 hypothetical protein [Euryarchaeota archaeon]
MSIVNTYNFFLTSATRNSGTASSYQTSLFRPIILSSPNNWFTVRVGSAEIPYVFKLITSANNTINFSITRNAITSTGSFTLTPGNYNILNLLNEVKVRLATAVSLAAGWDPTNYLAFTYDRPSGHATFTIIGIDSIATSITIQNNSPVFLKCVGFTTSFTFGYTTPLVRTYATSTQNVNVSQNTAVYIRSDSLIQSTNIENLIQGNEVSDILAKIQINSSPQSYILWTNPTDLEVKINNRIIDTIGLTVGSSTAYEVDLDNLDWSIRLTVHEWSNSVDEEDLAINLNAPQAQDEGVQKLLEERQKAVAKLEKLRKKLNVDIV